MKLMDQMCACDSLLIATLLQQYYMSCMQVHTAWVHWHCMHPLYMSTVWGFNHSVLCLILLGSAWCCFHIGYKSICVYWLCQECIRSKNKSITHSVLLAIYMESYVLQICMCRYPCTLTWYSKLVCRIFVFILELPTIQYLGGCELTGVITMLSAWPVHLYSH